MKRTLAGISHKGGTGRSVTLANIAFHLALRKHDVCVVDLDLTSPTMGAVLGMTDYEMGCPDDGSATKPRSIFDLLYESNGDAVIDSINSAFVNVWTTSPKMTKAASSHHSYFRLLPGRANIALDLLDLDRLIDVLEVLNERHKVVLLDVRSGNSEVADTLMDEALDEVVSGWLIHYRWTHQHLAGVHNFAERFFRRGEDRFADRVKLIRTAVPSRDVSGERGEWIREYDKDLKSALKRLPQNLQEAGIGEIPFDEMLLWQETVITDDDVRSGRAKPETYQAFDRVTKQVMNMVGLSDE